MLLQATFAGDTGGPFALTNHVHRHVREAGTLSIPT